MEDGKTFVCKKCSKVFKQSSGLSRHKKGCSSDSTSKLYKCNTCLKTFTRNDSLMKHIKGRCKTQGFSCNLCEKKFLKRHLLVHSPKPIYNCENCKKSFKRRNLYEKHKCVNLLCIDISGITQKNVGGQIVLDAKGSSLQVDTCESYDSGEDSGEEFSLDGFPTMIQDFHNDYHLESDNVVSEEDVSRIVDVGESEDQVLAEDHIDSMIPEINNQVVPESESSFTENNLTELLNDAARRKLRSRVAHKVADLIKDSKFQSSDDELDSMILSLKKLDLIEKMKERLNDHKVDSKAGRKRTPFQTCNGIWKFWHRNATTSTITSRPAKLRIGNRPKLQNGLPFIDTVEFKKVRNVDHFQSQWLILNKSYRDLYNEYVKSNQYVSYGTFLTLKLFYIRPATTKDFEVCCCKLHLEARWTVEALIKLCQIENIVLRFSNYDEFFHVIYGECTCNDETKHVYVDWNCTPNKKSVCTDISVGMT